MNHLQIRDSFAVYKVLTDFNADQTFFVGCCPLSTVAMMTDAWTYTMFREHIGDGRAMLRVSIIGIYADRDAAEAVQQATVMAENVWLNQHSERCEPVHRGARGMPVRNTATGMRYANASDAARAIGVTGAAMSHHLSGKMPTVKGQKFERIVE